MRRSVIKLLLISVLVLVVIGITGCQSQVIPPVPEVPCSIEITNPTYHEHLDGNGTYEIKWDWTGSDKEINLMLVGYDENEEEIGMMGIKYMIPASNESYAWGPNFGAEIFANFEDWPYRFKIEADVPDTDIWDASDFFSVQWDYNL